VPARWCHAAAVCLSAQREEGCGTRAVLFAFGRRLVRDDIPRVVTQKAISGECSHRGCAGNVWNVWGHKWGAAVRAVRR